MTYFQLVCFFLTLAGCKALSNSFVSTTKLPSFLQDILGKKPMTPSSKVQSVVVTGASGSVGQALAKKLSEQQIKVIRLSTSPEKFADDENLVTWSPERGAISNVEKLEGVDAIIHLAGENVASGDKNNLFSSLTGSWTEEKKQRILQSRVDSTKLLVDAMKSMKRKPRVFLSASGIGFYGYNDFATVFSDKDSTVSQQPGAGFLADVVDQWEAEALKAKDLGIRTVTLRLAPIFTPKSGILSKLYPIFWLGAGGVVGSGQQPLSWVSLNDVLRTIDFCLDKPQISGPINVCSPQSVTNAQFTAAFARVLNRPAFLPVPELALKIAMGQMAEEMLLGGQRAVPSKLMDAGFRFEDEEIEQALRNVLSV